MTAHKERTPGTWTVEKWPAGCPDLFTYNIVSDVDPATDQYHVSRYGVASGLDSEVDANLMAAAPELLEALAAIVDRLSAWEEGARISGDDNARVNYSLLCGIAYTAIARATGGHI